APRADAAGRARAVVGGVPDRVRDRARGHAARAARRRGAAAGANPGHGDRGRAARRRDPGVVRRCGAKERDGMTAQTIARYAAFSRIAVAQARRERGEIYGRVVFFAVILGVFSSLWRAIGEAGMPLGADRRALVWYLAMTEWILLSAPPIHPEVPEAILRGDVRS